VKVVPQLLQAFRGRTAGRICPRLHNEQDLTAQRNGLTALDVTEDLIYVDRSLIGATEHGQDCP